MLSGIESGSAMYKINTLLAVVSLHKNTFHFYIAKMNYNKRKICTYQKGLIREVYRIESVSIHHAHTFYIEPTLQ